MFNKKVIALAIIILMIGSIVIVSMNYINNNNNNNARSSDPTVQDVINNLDSYENSGLVKCMNDLGVKVFISKTCPHCHKQEEFFGESFWGLNYTDCYYDLDKCKAEGIESVPTWIINGTTYSGARPLSVLSSLTGCLVN